MRSTLGYLLLGACTVLKSSLFSKNTDSFCQNWQFPLQQERVNTALSEKERQALVLRNHWLAHNCFPISTRRCNYCLLNNYSPRSHFKDYYAYPWFELEQDSKASGHTSFPLLTYGSLMHPESSSSIMQDQRLMLGIGLKRVFNYLHPTPSSSLLGLPDKDHWYECLRLNVTYTGSLTDCIEGIVGTIELKNLDYLRQREIGYDLVKVSIIEPERVTTCPIRDLKEAYVLFAPSYHSQVTSNTIYRPHLNYLNLCAEGLLLRNGSPAKFLRETLLLDTKTTVFDWIEEEAQKFSKMVRPGGVEPPTFRSVV